MRKLIIVSVDNESVGQFYLSLPAAIDLYDEFQEQPRAHYPVVIEEIDWAQFPDNAPTIEEYAYICQALG